MVIGLWIIVVLLSIEHLSFIMVFVYSNTNIIHRKSRYMYTLSVFNLVVLLMFKDVTSTRSILHQYLWVIDTVESTAISGQY